MTDEINHLSIFSLTISFGEVSAQNFTQFLVLFVLSKTF